MADDDRDDIYRAFADHTLAPLAERNRTSARRILQLLFEFVRPASVLDVGCGIGTWLGVARELGATDVRGVEGTWLDRSKLEIDAGLVELCDLERGFSLGRRFDLALCLEVAEHLAPEAAEPFVASLCGHSDLVLFSAAIPDQGGERHLNERFLDYWAAQFARHGMRPVDLIRPRLWLDRTVLWWFRQNLVLFAHERALATHPKLAAEADPPPMLSVVHPEFYLWRARRTAEQLRELDALSRYLAQGGTFQVTPQPDGRFSVQKL